MDLLETLIPLFLTGERNGSATICVHHVLDASYADSRRLMPEAGGGLSRSLEKASIQGSSLHTAKNQSLEILLVQMQQYDKNYLYVSDSIKEKEPYQ